MVNFRNFFQDLYGKPSLNDSKITALRAEMATAAAPINGELTAYLSETISIDELKRCVKMLKKGKAVAGDLIPIEFLKAFSESMLSAEGNLRQEKNRNK